MLDDRVAELERANAELQRKLDERTAERDEAIARETATAEVLGVINASAGDLAPVFQAILEKALRICGATAGNLLSYDGEFFHVEAAVHADGRIAENQLDRPPLLARSDRHNLLHPLLEGKDFALSEDVRESNGYRQDPAFREMIDGGGYRSLLNVALRKESALLGSIGIYRQVVRPFTDKQIALLQNFAAQAVIAMENARLITETRKALERQTATAEVLGVINAHPGDLTPVFDAILEKAHALCGAEVGTLTAYDGEHFHALATFGYSEQFAAFVRRPFRPNVYMQRLIEGERVLHLPDQRTLESEPPDAGTTRAFLELTDLRTTLFVALRTDTSLLGYISAHRHGVHPFSEKEIALLENFATQAVIAMENARLLGELRQRTADLEESLGYQTATSEVLQVIGRSTFDLEPVLQNLVETAVRICAAEALRSICCMRTDSIGWRPPPETRGNTASRWHARRLRRDAALWSGAQRLKGGSCISRMCMRIPSSHSVKGRASADSGPSLACHCCARTSRSVSLLWSAIEWNRSPSGRSNWYARSPPRRSLRSRTRDC